MADGCNERRFISVLDMKQEKKKDKLRKKRNSYVFDMIPVL